MSKFSKWIAALKGAGYTHDKAINCVRLSSIVPAAGTYPQEDIEVRVWQYMRITTFDTWWSKPIAHPFYIVSPITSNRVPSKSYNRHITIHDTVDNFESIMAQNHDEAFVEYIELLVNTRHEYHLSK